MSWLKPHDRASTALFKKYRSSALRGVVPVGGTTVQGVYCMTADGEYLSGFFAWAFPKRAKRTIQAGWDRFERLAKTRSWKMQAVPTTKLDFTGGKSVARGRLKLEVAVRDLPRGDVLRPGRNEIQRCAHNVNWVDLSPGEAASFVTASKTPKPIPDALLQRIALKKLKDSVRGQCADWPKGSLRDGKLLTQRIRTAGNVRTMRLTGYVVLQTSTRSFACALHGRVVYDAGRRAFKSFELIAAGQRRGRTQFNFREDDPGPAPLGVALRMVGRNSSQR